MQFLITITDLHGLWSLNGKHLSQQAGLRRHIHDLHSCIVLPGRCILIQNLAPWCPMVLAPFLR